MATTKEKSKKEVFNQEETITNEITRLTELFKDLEDGKKKLALKLIENAAFMSATLERLKEQININGIKEEYKNGENQFGHKESVEVKNYNTIIKNYMNIIKQLNDMLPDGKQIPPEDKFDSFNGVK